MSEDRTILITGASSSVAAAVIPVIAPFFSCIYAHYSSSEVAISKLKNTFGEKIKPLQADFSKQNDIEYMLEEIESFGHIPDSILHLPASPYQILQFRKTKWDDFQLALDIQLRSLMFLSQAFLPMMSKKHFGRIVVLLSSVTVNTPPKFVSTYVCTKYAMLGLARALAAEYADKGVTINCISPEMMETQMLKNVPELLIQQNATNSPMGRNASPSDIIPIISYLLSKDSNYTTGQNFAITGGR